MLLPFWRRLSSCRNWWYHPSARYTYWSTPAFYAGRQHISQTACLQYNDCGRRRKTRSSDIAETARRPTSVEIVSRATQMHEKSHLKKACDRRITLKVTQGHRNWLCSIGHMNLFRDIISFFSKKFSLIHKWVLVHTWSISMPNLICTASPITKMWLGLLHLKWSRNHDHARFRDDLSSIGYNEPTYQIWRLSTPVTEIQWRWFEM